MNVSEIVNMNIDKLIRKKQYATRNNNLLQLAEVTRSLGDIYYENEELKKALQEYTEQLRICESLKDKLSCAIAHRMIGEVYVSLGNYEQALIHQNLYLQGAKDMKNLIEEQRAFATLGRTHFCLADSLLSQSQEQKEALANAKSAYVKSMELCDQLTSADVKLEERTLMRARLLLNLGLTLETQKETQQAIDLIEQATALCVSNNFQEDLHRACISLSGIYERQGDLELALNYLETAATVNDTCLKAEAKVAKAKMLMQYGQWIKSRKILVALYASTGLAKDINRQVEKYLRIVVTLCRAEDSLLVETDVRVKQKLYEMMGDAAVAVKCFDKGAEYYRHMLACAEETGEEEIGVALTSLAQTLKDAKRYEEALSFARRELELYASNPRERCQSALFLADLLATSNATDTEIHEHYVMALRSANESDDAKLQRSAAKELIAYLESVGRLDEAENTRQTVGLISSVASSDTESEMNEEDDQIGADICLEDLSDLEPEENVATTSKIHRRKKKSALAIKRNEKGETRLHVACINGDIGTVERLLSAGHPTNVRDHCGWSPLHEAANHGHVEIVEVLLKHDANVNDPGGASCKGVTPLHDAASCGHFSVMQLLMEHGANLTLKTHDGDTVLDCLEDWRERAAEDLSPEHLVEYETMHNRLSAVIITSKRKSKKSAESVRMSNNTQPEVQKISAGEDYKRTIASLRNFNKIKKVDASGRSSNDVDASPLVSEEQVLVDDWLEDDIAIESTARRRPSRHVVSKRKSANNSVESTSKRPKRSNGTVESEEDLGSEDGSDNIAAEAIEMVEELKRIERRRQGSLLSNGFTVSRTPSPIYDLQSSLRTSSTSSTWYRKEHVYLCVLVKDKLFDLRVNVCENGEEFLTGIVSASERAFFNATGCTAKLMLQPLNGSVATKESILKVAGESARSSDAIKLECQIVELQVPPIVERYKTLCCTRNETPCEIMLKCLRSCENTSTFRVKPGDTDKAQLMLVSLLQTLEYQKNIKLLQLSGIILSTEGMRLGQCLSNISSLQELYLRGCNIEFACLRQITTLPCQLRVLDLSYNPLSAESRETLQKLVGPLKYLQTLNLRYCELEEFCLPLDNPNLTSCDVSWNKLNSHSVTSFLSRRLFKLNLSNTLSPYCRLTSSLDARNYHETVSVLSPSLESLELSFCDITDFDVKSILARLPRLLKLILRGNKSVTVSSINVLLSRSPSLTYIDVSGCDNIVSTPEVGLVIQNPETCTFLASVEPDLCNSWIKLWRGTGIVTRLPHNVTIFKPV